MSHHLWLADAARAWGLTVVECDGWQTRGSTSFAPAGVVAHHTAGPSGGGDMPSLGTLINGRPDLDGPLANYGLGRSGTVYVIAAGRANHAGNGGWMGLSGNSSVVGIEAENDGYQDWPPVQLDAYGRLGAAICQRLAVAADYVCRHHEWRSEKPDPHDLDGDAGRAQVAQLLAGGPAQEDDMAKATYLRHKSSPQVYLAGVGFDPRPVTLFADIEYHFVQREGGVILDPPSDARESVADASGTTRNVMVVSQSAIFGIPEPGETG